MKLVHVFSAPQSAFFFMKGQLNYMQDNGVKVTVIMPMDKVFNPKFIEQNPGVNVVNITIKREISILNDIDSLCKLIKQFYKLDPDIIHLHTPKASLLGVIAGRVLFKKPIIYQMHGLISIEGNKVKKNIVHYMEKMTCRLATKILAVSSSIMNFAIEHNYCPSKKIKVIGHGSINGINYENRFNPALIKFEDGKLNSLKSKNFIIGFVGRLLRDKGIEDYLKVISKFKENKIPVMGFVVGPNESGNDFKDYLSNYNLKLNDDIIVFGQKLEPEKIMVYFDVLLLPTKREGFGLVAAEANALEIPVIGYNIPGFKDAVVNGKTGKLVSYKDTEKLYKATLKYYQNPSLKDSHGKKGRERVIQDFNSSNLWRSLLNEYERLLS